MYVKIILYMLEQHNIFMLASHYIIFVFFENNLNPKSLLLYSVQLQFYNIFFRTVGNANNST